MNTSVGFGLDLHAGFKEAAIEGSNASVSFQRFPMGGGIHALLRLDERWFLVPLGLFGDVRARLSGSGDASGLDVPFATGLGL